MTLELQVRVVVFRITVIKSLLSIKCIIIAFLLDVFFFLFLSSILSLGGR